MHWHFSQSDSLQIINHCEIVIFHFTKIAGKKILNENMLKSNEKRWQKFFSQQIVRQDYDWKGDNSEEVSLWNIAMLIELGIFFLPQVVKLLALNVETENTSFLNWLQSSTEISFWKISIGSALAKFKIMHTLFKIFIMNFHICIESNMNLFYYLQNKVTIA